mmetsp:Transcript_25066/g.64020  ORF Transcript_25066/g.64020 Transcript_25066/m.64020 type:complete len:214 (-) Transcript_25066:253-894(-)
MGPCFFRHAVLAVRAIPAAGLQMATICRGGSACLPLRGSGVPMITLWDDSTGMMALLAGRVPQAALDQRRGQQGTSTPGHVPDKARPRPLLDRRSCGAGLRQARGQKGAEITGGPMLVSVLVERGKSCLGLLAHGFTACSPALSPHPLKLVHHPLRKPRTHRLPCRTSPPPALLREHLARCRPQQPHLTQLRQAPQFQGHLAQQGGKPDGQRG